MAKKFMYASLGVMCLCISYSLGANSASAEWDSSLSGQVIGFAQDNSPNQAYVVARNGDLWAIETVGGWTQRNLPSEQQLPVSVEDIKFYGGNVLVTNGDEAWVDQGFGVGWVSFGVFPGPPVGIERESFGAVKGLFR